MAVPARRCRLIWGDDASALRTSRRSPRPVASHLFMPLNNRLTLLITISWMLIIC